MLIEYKIGDWLGQSIIVNHFVREEKFHKVSKGCYSVTGFRNTTSVRKHGKENTLKD